MSRNKSCTKIPPVLETEILSTNTESQNHRIVGVGRDLCGSSSPTLLLKHTMLITLTKYFQNMRLTQCE